MVRVTLERLGLTEEPVEVALGGGLMQSGDIRLIGAVEVGLRRVAPAATLHVTGSPPIVGAALLGLDQLGAGARGAAAAARRAGGEVHPYRNPSIRRSHATGKESTMKRLLVLLLAVGLTAAACGGNKSGGSAGSSSVTISNEQGTTWTCGFNPFNASVSFLSFGTEYEELTYVDGLKSGATTPWLATSYAWSNGNKTLTFTLRQGVKWSDGKPFSADDVVYTFQLLKKYPALDLNANWSVLKSVTQNGDKVAFNFKTAAVPYFYYIADQTPIVAKHIWSSIKNPTTYKDEHPVGTGPYTMSSCSPQVIKYKKNPSYWQSGKPVIDTVYYPAFTSNDPANQQLASGKAQWGSQFIPNINKFYVSKSADNHYWFPPVVNVAVYINQRTRSSPTSPCERRWRTRSTARRSRRSASTATSRPRTRPGSSRRRSATGSTRAREAGRLRPGEGRIDPPAGRLQEVRRHHQTPDGKPLSFTMINIGGYSDWVASAQIVAENLKAIGIKVTAQNLSSQTYDSDVYNGHYQLAYDGNQSAGRTPYYELRSV